jgi:2-polyprenyl-6-hydroxyphenyl methylase/3-demethylubiquinone-9 3-methyltransferase
MTGPDQTLFQRDTIDDVDLAKYDRLGAEWWNPQGPMQALHKFNPVRVAYIRDLLVGRTPASADRPLAGLRILDIGSGGGILSESLARLGADMVGIDPAPNNIAIAARHAETGGLAIDYRCTTVETLALAGEETFDAVLVMEVVEHVRDVPGFLRDAAALVRPGGLIVGATLNRTLKSYALAIVGAEYVLGWLPKGTHNWHQFVTPAEFKGHFRRAGLTQAAEAGVTYNPLTTRWSLSRDMGVNYMVAARRPV